MMALTTVLICPCPFVLAEILKRSSYRDFFVAPPSAFSRIDVLCNSHHASGSLSVRSHHHKTKDIVVREPVNWLYQLTLAVAHVKVVLRHAALRCPCRGVYMLC